jgi:uncharacterized protein (DUF488 family)
MCALFRWRPMLDGVVANQVAKQLGGDAMMTIGHSTLTIEAFLRALCDNGVHRLVDVRRYPGSRRHPQFGQEALFASLRAAGIEPVWREGLGGRRKACRGSVNSGWRESSFRGYADYMQTQTFRVEMDWLIGQPQGCAVMCAEALPWRCHRSLIADALIARDRPVEDIFVEVDGRSMRKPHGITPFAHVEGERIWYPGESGELFAAE